MGKFFHLVDFFSFFPIPHTLESQTFSELYEKYELSVKQIAERVGVSKSTVLKKLKEGDTSLRSTRESLTNSKNYRSPNPPYGFKVVEGRLVENRAEIRICRKIIEMREKGASFNAISQLLREKGLKNRKQTLYWCHKHLKRIYNYWKEKL